MGAVTQMPTPPDSSGQDNRRADIIAKATELFVSKGYAATSMSALADACGIQKPSLYHHFRGKQALVLACVMEGYDVAIERLRKVGNDPKLTHEERFREAMAENYRTIVSSPVGRMSPLIAEVSLQFPDVAKTFHDRFIMQQHEIMSAIIDGGVAAGAFVDLDRLGLKHLIFGPIVTLSLSRDMFASLDTLETHFPVERIRDSHCDLLLKLMRAGSAAQTAPDRAKEV